MSDPVSQLVQIANIPEAQASALLEAAGGNLEVAISLAFEQGNEVRPTPAPVANSPTPQIAQALPQPTQHKPGNQQQQQQQRPKIVGFGDYSTPKEEDPNKKKDLSWFTGGASSGISVEVPQQQKPEEVVNNVFESAKKMGAIAKSDEKPKEKEKYGGAGFVLGNTDHQSKVIPGAPKPQGPRRVIIKFYKDCFTVDDGPPRKTTDPANRTFIEDVNKGVVPRELAGNGDDVDVELIDKKTEEYKPPPLVSFSGSGQALGGQQASHGSRANAKKVVVDDSAPTTTIQVRTHNGQRLIIKANHSHTVGDIRAHIEAEHPTGKPFELRTTFPPQVLGNDNATIKDAGLLNAAIVQRL